MLFTSALAVASLGTAAALGASDLTAETFIEQTSEDISALLAEWGMDRVFADEFSAVQVDGEALAHTPQDELEAAFAHANIATMHWNRLHRRLAPFRNAVVMPEAGDSAGPGAAGGARRSLQSTVEPDGYSGIRMNHNKSMVTFGNDMAILRTETGIDAVTPLLTIHGDLNISGTAYGDFPGSSAGDYGTSRGNPAKSCRAILQRNDAARDGIYYITRLGAKAPFRAYCDMSRGGLELVFKISHGVGGDAQTLWDDKSALNEETKYMNVLSNGHYSSSQKASAWKHNNLLAVNTHIMQGNTVARYMTFDPSNQTYISWFSDDTVVASDWTDLLSEDKNFFSIAGDTNYGREFFVNANYGGCTVDAGWMVLDNEDSDPCDWEKDNNGATGDIDILYSPYTTLSNADADWVQGDTFTVLVDIDEVFDSCPDALEQLEYTAKDGHYWVDHNGQTDPQIVYCDMANGGYELVFKVVHGGGITDANTLWTGGTSGEDYTTSPLSSHSANPTSMDEHYVSPFRRSAFDSDLGLTVDEVDVRVITDGVVKKYLHFVLDSSATYTSWFGSGYLQSSSWNDVLSTTRNYFSIAGDTSNVRSFFVNANYGGCAVDAGWVVVAGKSDGVCDWEDVEESYPDIRYSRLNTLDQADTYGVADLLAVFYKWH